MTTQKLSPSLAVEAMADELHKLFSVLGLTMKRQRDFRFNVGAVSHPFNSI